MFTVYQIAFVPPQIPYRIGPQFVHKNGCVGVISMMEQSWAAPIPKAESHISDRCSYNFGGATKAIQYRVNIA